MPIWVLEKPNFRADQKMEIDEGEAKIITQEIQPTMYKSEIESLTSSKVRVNSVYFPGWRVEVDEKKQPIDYKNKHGLITFSLPKGRHEVIIKYGKTPVHLASEIMSLLALIGTGGYLYFLWRRQNQK